MVAGAGGSEKSNAALLKSSAGFFGAARELRITSAATLYLRHESHRSID
jgi:hypothetical protein